MYGWRIFPGVTDVVYKKWLYIADDGRLSRLIGGMNISEALTQLLRDIGVVVMLPAKRLNESPAPERGMLRH